MKKIKKIVGKDNSMQLIDMILGYLCLFSNTEFRELRKGSPEELKKLYLHYKEPFLYFLLIHLKGNRAVADDILQETFEIVIKAPGKSEIGIV